MANESKKPVSELPAFLRRQLPELSDVFVVDARLAVIPFVRALAAAGYSVVNLLDGRLVITQAPEDFRL